MSNIYIIGNGPSALAKPLGTRIDHAGVVIRLNDFKTTGFEQFVGTRTDILFTCRLNEYFDTLHKFREVVLCLLMNPLDGVTVPDEVLNFANIVHRIDWPAVEAITPTLGLRDGCYPTTGFLAVMYAIRRFGHVNLIGFDGLGGGNRHYYEDDARAIPIRHDGNREREWLDLFETLGLITDLNRSETPKFYKFDGHDPFISQKSIT